MCFSLSGHFQTLSPFRLIPQIIANQIFPHMMVSQKLNNMLDRGIWRHWHFVVGVAGTTIEPQVRRGGGGGGGGGVYGLGGYWLKRMRVLSHIDSMFGRMTLIIHLSAISTRKRGATLKMVASQVRDKVSDLERRPDKCSRKVRLKWWIYSR